MLKKSVTWVIAVCFLFGFFQLQTIPFSASATDVSVTGITLAPQSVQVDVGSTAAITATIAPDSTTNKTLSWSSSDEKIATVDSNGVVTGIAAGSATVTAISKDGSNISSSVPVTVNTVTIKTITLSGIDTPIYITQTVPITATITPTNATNKTFAWSSSNTSVASVDSTGKVTALTPGETTIIATTQDGSNISGTLKVTVANAPVSNSSAILVSGTGVYNGALSSIDPNGNSLTYSVVSKPLHGTLTFNSDGTFKYTPFSLYFGNDTFTYKTNNGTSDSNIATVSITVFPILVDEINLNQQVIKLSVGGSTKLVATLFPNNTTTSNVSWLSSNEKIATVDDNGVVTAIAPGTATITVQAQDGGYEYSTATVTVTTVKNEIPIPNTGDNGILLFLFAFSVTIIMTTVLIFVKHQRA